MYIFSKKITVKEVTKDKNSFNWQYLKYSNKTELKLQALFSKCHQEIIQRWKQEIQQIFRHSVMTVEILDQLHLQQTLMWK